MGLMEGEYISIQDNKQMFISQYSNGVQVRKSRKDTSSENGRIYCTSGYFQLVTAILHPNNKTCVHTKVILLIVFTRII